MMNPSGLGFVLAPILLGGFLFSLGFWWFVIRIAVSRAQNDAGLVMPGFKGYLYILAVIQWVQLLFGRTPDLVWVALTAFSSAQDAAQDGIRHRGTVFVLLAIVALQFLVAAVCTAAMARRSQLFPRLFELQYWLALTAPPALVIGIAFVLKL